MLFSFGDVFRYQEREYVYLAQINEITYAARVLDELTTRELVQAREKVARKNQENDKPMYCFVVLTTQPFDGRAAHVGSAGEANPPIDYPDKICTLCEEDTNSLKNEISDSKGVPMALREYVKNLQAA